jgi:hypothetical protein
MNMPNEHWIIVEQALNDFQEWYCGEILTDSAHFAVKKDTILKGIDKIKEMRKMDQQDMEFFVQSTEDYLKHMREYSNMDKVRGTDFMKTFPELDWLYK